MNHTGPTDSSDSDNEIQFIEPLSMSGTLKPRDLSPNLSRKTSHFYENVGERIAGIISAFITVCLMISLYFTHLIFVFLPWMNNRINDGYSDTDIIGILLWTGLGILTLFLLMGMWSFCVALLTDNSVKTKDDESEEQLSKNTNEEPGTVGRSDSVASSNELRIKRWCKKCNQEKPLRSHHCSVCNVCVLRMDHHCPWINNCVGYMNHGHYLRFLFYVIAAMLTCLVLLASRLAFFKGQYLYWYKQRNGSFFINLTDEMLQMTFLVADVVGCGILSALIGLLLAVQLVNVSQGHTTIESLEIIQCERDMKREQRRLNSLKPIESLNAETSLEIKSGVKSVEKPVETSRTKSTNKFPFPFDLGFDTNLKGVFGQNPYLWPFPLPITMNPLSGSSADGKQFETRSDAFMNGQWPLPSKDPLLAMKAARRGSLDDGGGFLIQNVNYSLHDFTQNQN